ncbi:MAG: hypothetical protein KME57_08435 [Scytonema hyalinum WJT4-NPBG1]|jgi:C1A family cysteine protease|nr:hypothetical protein [Scytonema hyalinum WJT4-NPBG1]
MKKRGTGWIPDYPDVNDHTLKSEAIQNLSNKIQSQGDTTSIENLAQKVCEALGILEEHQNRISEALKINKELENNNNSNQKNITSVREALEKEILGDIRFVTVEFHNVFKEKMADSEVLLIKNYLQRILETWKQLKDNQNNESEQLDDEHIITAPTFDTQTRDAVIRVIKTQNQLQSDGLVGKDDMTVLKELARISKNVSNIEFLLEFTEKWEKSKKWEKSNEDHTLQITVASYLSSILKKTNELRDQANLSIKEIENFLSSSKIVDELPEDAYQAIVQNGYEQDSKKQTQKKQHEQESDTYKQKEKVPEKQTESIQICRLKLNEIINDIKNDSEQINKVASSFRNKQSLIKDDEFKELRELLCEQGLTKKINAFETLLEDLDNLQKYNTQDSDSKKYKIGWKIGETSREFEKIVKQIYRISPPPILPQLLKKREIPITSPIPESVVNLFKKNLLAIQSSEPEIEDKTQQLIQPIIEVLAQMLMPLAQHGNLGEAVERAIEKIQHLLECEKGAQEDTKNLIRESIEEYNFGLIRDFSLIQGVDFKNLILKTLPQFEIEIKKDTSLYCIFEKIEKIKQCKHSQEESQKETCQTKKPLFEISHSELNRLINVGQTLCKSTENSSQPMKNSLQFPINSRLRKLITENPQNDEKIFLSLPEFVDLSYLCSPLEDQGSLNSCTAHAGIALIEYAQKKSFGTYIDGSSRFLYKVTRNLMQREGDSGASVRDMMKAMVAFGVCPEQYWRYDEDKFDEEPTPFCYSFAENYKTLKYFRLDYASISRHTLLAQVKVLLASEIPCIFGFTLYNSVYDEVNVQRGHIPLPHERDKVIGGHTVVAVGYHDRKVIENGDANPSEGALLIRNSWGTRWGQGGYGWLPYDYIVQGLTADWWSLLKAEWLATGRFGAGASAWNADKGTNNVPNVPPASPPPPPPPPK